ncbi:class I SAM-dependent methyltransferase [Catalinimonas niigatensis]|uniref:class I SAM-dependent methyltransferase n=1 Tax=Catalinimonas niigatensis TaxID=1397264 RepID=UPI002666F038|nr:class I SAM-dependent methyltransferase [Catalinimonas niigatensis]WPP53286.1 class I SAM-dependent methyltransferase [Catalinimonas niigatensis]
MSPQDINRLLGNIDLYLLDHILKGRFTPDMRLLDVGCGEGRNLVYFIRQGYDVWGIDKNPAALQMLRLYGRSLHPDFDPEKFIEDDGTSISLPPMSFDGVISSAVLHFADDHTHFHKMFAELVRVLRPGGLLFIRTAMLAGIEQEAIALESTGRYYLPDGSERYLLSSDSLEKLCLHHGIKLLEPLKYVVVQDARSMGSMLLQKYPL